MLHFLSSLSLTVYVLVTICAGTFIMLLILLGNERSHKKEHKKKMDNIYLSLEQLSVIWNHEEAVQR